MNFKNRLISNLIIMIPALIISIITLPFVFKSIHNPLNSELTFFSIFSVIALVIAFFVRREIIILITMMMFSLALSVFIEQMPGFKNYHFGNSILGLIFFSTALIVVFFQLYFEMPKNERSFAAAYKAWRCYLSSGGNSK